MKSKKLWRTMRILLGSTGAACFLGFCFFASKAYARAQDPMNKSLEKIQGRYRGTMTLADKQVLKGGLEVVKTGEVFQLVGGFMDKATGVQSNFNKRMTIEAGRYFFDDVEAKVASLDSFSKGIQNSFEINTEEQGNCMKMKVQYNKPRLKMDLSLGKDLNQLKPIASIEVEEVQL